MKSLLYVFIGGGVGSIFRFMISNYTQKLLLIGSFPFGTLLVNVLGCFLIGIFSVFFKENEYLKYLLVTGFCGGFTTYSTFSMENISLWQNGQYMVSVLYLGLSIVLGLSAVYLGSQSFK